MAKNKPLFKAGQIGKCLSTWQTITSDPFILNLVQGSHIPIEDFDNLEQISGIIPPNTVKGCQIDFVDQEVEKLLLMEVIELSNHEKGEIISPIFLVDKPDGSFRMILNLKKFNECVSYEHFKMEHFSFVTDLIEENCYMASIDLSNAFYSVPIHKNYRKFLKFMWKGQLYNFTCFANGLCMAPRYFTKIMKPVFATLRSKGHISSSFLDDCYLQGQTFEECSKNVQDTLELLQSLGFVIHPEKSVLQPKKSIKHLGFIINSEEMRVTLSEEKKVKILRSADQLLKSPLVTIRQLARFIGMLVASFPAVLWGRLYYRKLESLKKKALKSHKGNYDADIMLNNEAVREITWWLANLNSAYYPLAKSFPSIEVFSDASLLGYGCVCEEDEFGGRWSNDQKDVHINALELQAIEIAILSFLHKLRGKHVKILCDNTCAVTYLNNFGGSRSDICNDIAFRIWATCRDSDIWITASFIAGKSNIKADFWSRHFDDNKEWKLDSTIFTQILHQLNTYPTIDLFATFQNTQLDKFVSWGPDPRACCTDAFSISWGSDIVYAFPPFCLILRALKKLVQDGAEGIFILPNWSTSIWYPLMLKLLVREPLILPRRPSTLLLPGTDKTHPLHKKLQLIAVVLSGKPYPRKTFREQQVTFYSHPGELPLSNSTSPICVAGKNLLGKKTSILFNIQ